MKFNIRRRYEYKIVRLTQKAPDILTVMKTLILYLVVLLFPSDALSSQHNESNLKSMNIANTSIIAQGYWDPDADKDLSEYGYNSVHPSTNHWIITLVLGFIAAVFAIITDPQGNKGKKSKKATLPESLFMFFGAWGIFTVIMVYPVQFACEFLSALF